MTIHLIQSSIADWRATNANDYRSNLWL